MSRYSLRLRPKYGENELTGPEQLSRGIGDFLGGYVARKDTERQERNTVGQAGGVILPDDPDDSIRGRWDRIKRGVGALLGHADVPPGSDLGTSVSGTAKDGVMPNYTDVMGGLTRRVPNVNGVGPVVMDGGGLQGTFSGAPGRPGYGTRPGTGWDERIPSEYDEVDGATAGGVMAANQQPHPAPPVASPPMIPAGARTPNGASIGAVLGGALGDDESFVYQGHGFRARMPNVIGQSRLQARAKIAEAEAENEPKIQALIDAGMDPKKARARVLNNVVRYDETFGQQRGRGGSGGASMTQEERLQIQDRLDRRAAQAQKVQLMLQNSRNMSADQRAKLNAELRELSIQSSADQALLRGAQSELNTTTGQLSKMQADPVAANTPTGRAAIGELRQRADSLGKVVQGAQGRVATKATPVPAQPAAPPPAAKRTINQAQYDKARAMGKTDAEIAALYNIDPSVRRKK